MRGLIAVVALVLILVAGVAIFLIPRHGPTSGPTRTTGEALIGGPFRLTDQNGRRVDQRILNGKWSVVFFGYTYCPDVCPTTLQTLAQGLDQLGPNARNVQVVFVSVDPQRDTPAQLRTYLSGPAMPPHAIGLTGTPAEVATAARAYRVYYARAGQGEGYTVNHSTAAYLMNPQGRFVRVMAYGLTPEETARQLREAMRDGR